MRVVFYGTARFYGAVCTCGEVYLGLKSTDGQNESETVKLVKRLAITVEALTNAVSRLKLQKPMETASTNFASKKTNFVRDLSNVKKQQHPENPKTRLRILTDFANIRNRKHFKLINRTNHGNRSIVTNAENLATLAATVGIEKIDWKKKKGLEKKRQNS